MISLPTLFGLEWPFSREVQKEKLRHLRKILEPTKLDLFIEKLKLNSVALVRKRTIPTEQPPLVGEVNANFCG
jgi:hypothetical protein